MNSCPSLASRSREQPRLAMVASPAAPARLAVVAGAREEVELAPRLRFHLEASQQAQPLLATSHYESGRGHLAYVADAGTDPTLQVPQLDSCPPLRSLVLR